MSGVFVLEPLSIDGQHLEFSVPYSAPHSELLTAIVARQDIAANPAPALHCGLEQAFEAVRKALQEVFLFGGREPQDMMLAEVERYLCEHPDERVSGYVAFVRENRPAVEVLDDQAGARARVQALKAKKRKEKLRAKSRRRNRKG